MESLLSGSILGKETESFASDINSLWKSYLDPFSFAVREQNESVRNIKKEYNWCCQEILSTISNETTKSKCRPGKSLRQLAASASWQIYENLHLGKYWIGDVYVADRPIGYVNIPPHISLNTIS